MLTLACLSEWCSTMLTLEAVDRPAERKRDVDRDICILIAAEV